MNNNNKQHREEDDVMSNIMDDVLSYDGDCSDEEGEIEKKTNQSSTHDRLLIKKDTLKNNSAPKEVQDAAIAFEKITGVDGISDILLHSKGAALRRSGWTPLQVCHCDEIDDISGNPFLEYTFVSHPKKPEFCVAFIRVKSELGWALKYKSPRHTQVDLFPKSDLLIMFL